MSQAQVIDGNLAGSTSAPCHMIGAAPGARICQKERILLLLCAHAISKVRWSTMRSTLAQVSGNTIPNSVSKLNNSVLHSSYLCSPPRTPKIVSPFF